MSVEKYLYSGLGECLQAQEFKQTGFHDHPGCRVICNVTLFIMKIIVVTGQFLTDTQTLCVWKTCLIIYDLKL